MAAQDPDQRSRNLVASTNRTLPVSGLPQDPQDVLEIFSVVLSKALEAVLFELSDLRGAWDEGTGSSGSTTDSKKLLSLANQMAMRGAGRAGDLTRVTVSHISAVVEEIAALRNSILTTPPVRDHGALTGLGDDDHSQYHNNTRGDARYHTQTELNGVSGATLIGHHLAIGGGSVDTVYNMLNHIIPHWMIEGGVVSDEGGLNIQWTAGGVYSSLTDAVAYFDARGTDLALTDDATNFLYYDGTTTLQVKTTELATNEIEIAHAHCANGEIFELHQEEGVNNAVTGILRGLAQVIPVIVTTGLVVSEDVDVTNPLDVSQSLGTYYRDMHDAVDVAAIDSRTSPMRRWHKDGGGTDFTYDTDAEIDTTQYDNAGTLTAIPNNRWVRSVFFTDGTYIHWIYAVEYFNTLAGALNAADPPMPTGLLGLPKTTALIYQEGDAVLPAAGGDQWIDVRPIIGAAGSNAMVSDHGSLGGVSSDQHHTESHTVVSHSDTTATGAELETLTDGSDADSLHDHAVADAHMADGDNPHATDIENLGAGTLAELNAAVSDATLDDSGDPRTPSAHKASHQNGGGDEISVVGLSGELADNQPPKTHASNHTDGTDDIQDATTAVKGIASFSSTDFTVAAGAVSLATKRRKFCKIWDFESPVAGKIYSMFRTHTDVPVTLTKILGETAAATNCVVQLYWRAADAQFTEAGQTQIMTANLTALTTEVNTTSFADATIPGNSRVVCKVISVSGTPGTVGITAEGTDD